MRGREFIRLFAGALATWSLIAHGQNSPADYPDRPITLVVPYAPGGGNDVLARAVAEHMSKSLDNRYTDLVLTGKPATYTATGENKPANCHRIATGRQL
jgi:tripartite-type tricarboxylate transporter receptor subunit TctC